jgi:hypothetical protein
MTTKFYLKVKIMIISKMKNNIKLKSKRRENKKEFKKRMWEQL